VEGEDFLREVAIVVVIVAAEDVDMLLIRRNWDRVGHVRYVD